MGLERGGAAPGWLLGPRGRVAVVVLGALLLGMTVLAGYPGRVVGLVGLGAIGVRVFRSRKGRLACAAGLALIAGNLLLAVVEHLLPGAAAQAATRGSDPSLVARVGSGLDVLTAVLLLPATVLGVGAGLIMVARAALGPADFSWIVRPNDAGAPANVVPPRSVLGPDQRPFPDSGLPEPRPDADLERPPAELGIAVSGGGIRAAAVTLGALQSLRKHGALARARYLVSVSGAGYVAGAFQLAMNDLPKDVEEAAEAAARPVVEPRVVAPDVPSPRRATGHPDPHAIIGTVTDPAIVFRPGSVEEDHIRRHGKYIADTAPEWLQAAGVVLRGAGASLALLAGVVCALGIGLGTYYRRVQIARVDYPYPFSPGARSHAPAFVPVDDGVVAAIVLSAGLGLLIWFGLIARISLTAETSPRTRLAATACLAVAGWVFAVGVVMPLLVWGGVRAIWWLNSVTPHRVSPTGLATGGAAGTVTFAYLGSLVSILWRSRTRISGLGSGWLGSRGRLRTWFPGAVVQRVTVWVVLGVITVLFTLLFGAVVRTAYRPGLFTRHPSEWHWWPHGFLFAVLAVLAVVTALVDETWMSLHGFYRRRLCAAFAVRRVELAPDVPAALPYDFERETTKLSTYGRPRPGFPQLILAAAASVSSNDRTPPGRRAVSFSFSHDWVGGPSVGYVRTAALEEQLDPHLRMDITLQNAVAVSGAAFGSAMGSKARAYQTLLALSNARLGTWLPNPAWLYRRCTEHDWTQPRLPRVRRVSYLLREVLGRYDARDRLLLVTDGGHYDMLGLVELLRHRCRTVVLVDAGRDAPPASSSLGHAISLAREELGVRIDLDHPFDLLPGSGAPLGPREPLAAVNARLSATAVVTGSITYPAPFRLEGECGPSATGRLILAKSTLTPDLPYDVLAYAADNPEFPYEALSDQWFDENQFNAYHAIGSYLGDAVADRLAPSRAATPPAGAHPVPPPSQPPSQPPGQRPEREAASFSG